MTKISKYILMSILFVSGMFLTTPAHAVLKHRCDCPNGEVLFVPVHEMPCLTIYEYDGDCPSDCQTKCEEAGYEASTSDPDPEEPTPQEPTEPSSGAAEAINIPSLVHFNITENNCTESELNFTFTPKGNSSFALHVSLKNEAGKDILSAWCTGDESICKAVGNGQACSGTDYTAGNAWCYKAQ